MMPHMTMRPALDEAWQRMDPFLERLAAKPETEAVVVLSNAAGARDRLPFDEHSDFDVGLVLSIPLSRDEWRPEPAETYRLVADRLPAWLPNFSFRVPVTWGRLEVNVNQLIYEYEADVRTTWDDAKCEAYAGTGRVLFDRSGRFQDVIRRKADECRRTHPRRLARLANRLAWDIELLPQRQAERGELLAAHHIVTRAVDEFIEACFLLAGRFLPNPKWRFLVLARQGLLTAEELSQLGRALRCDPTCRPDLERRISELAELWASVRRRTTEVPEDPYRAFAASQIQLRPVTFADAVRQSEGEQASDHANYLLAHSPGSSSAGATDRDEPPGAEPHEPRPGAAGA